MEKRYLNEWERAKDFLNAVKNNLKLNDLKTVANKEYFAVERAVVCVLILEKKEIPKDHKKIWEMSRFLDLDIDVYSQLCQLLI